MGEDELVVGIGESVVNVVGYRRSQVVLSVRITAQTHSHLQWQVQVMVMLRWGLFILHGKCPFTVSHGKKQISRSAEVTNNDYGPCRCDLASGSFIPAVQCQLAIIEKTISFSLTIDRIQVTESMNGPLERPEVTRSTM